MPTSWQLKTMKKPKPRKQRHIYNKKCECGKTYWRREGHIQHIGSGKCPRHRVTLVPARRKQ